MAENEMEKESKPTESLQEMLEFYFSDSNLSKDRFMRQKIGENDEGLIDISVFLKFNKVKSVTEKIEPLVEAIKSSTLLSLFENNGRYKVKRSTPIPEVLNFDKQTVYVENFPKDSTHETLKKLFSNFGKISYISLPRYEKDGSPKGFSFIEFELPEEATTFIEQMNQLQSDETIQKESSTSTISDRDLKILKKMRAISKLEWLELRKEYKAYLYQQQIRVYEQKVQEQSIPEMVSNVLIEFQNLSPNSKSGILKEFFSKFGVVEYVDYTRGQTNAILRFKDENEANKTFDHFSQNSVTHSIEDEPPQTKPITPKRLQGKDERNYWEEIQKKKKEKEEKKQNRLPTKERKKLEKQEMTASLNLEMDMDDNSNSLPQAPKKKTKKKRVASEHVRFDDDDGDENDEEDMKEEEEKEEEKPNNEKIQDKEETKNEGISADKSENEKETNSSEQKETKKTKGKKKQDKTSNQSNENEQVNQTTTKRKMSLDAETKKENKKQKKS